MSGVTNAQGVSAVDPSSGFTFNNPTFTGTVHGGVTRLLCGAIPLIYVSGGTMGNNGSLSALTTALSRAVPRCYVMLPAGAIATGVPAAAAWYYAEFSTTAAATVYNNVFDPTQNVIPTIPASKTAFVTTGPGAFIGVTAEMTALQYTIAAGAMGTSGQLRVHIAASANSSAFGKAIKLKFGGSQFGTVDLASNTAGWVTGTVTIAGETGTQHGEAQAQTGNTNANVVPAELTVNSANAVAAIVTVTKGTSSDNIIIETYDFDLSAP